MTCAQANERLSAENGWSVFYRMGPRKGRARLEGVRLHCAGGLLGHFLGREYFDLRDQTCIDACNRDLEGHHSSLIAVLLNETTTIQEMGLALTPCIAAGLIEGRVLVEEGLRLGGLPLLSYRGPRQT
jgi:hypothetical protein